MDLVVNKDLGQSPYPFLDPPANLPVKEYSPPFILDEEADYYSFNLTNNSKSWLYKISYNLKYNIQSGVNESIEDLFIQSNEDLVLLGKRYINTIPVIKKVSYQKFKKRFSRLIWVSYRSHFRPLFRGSEQITSDIGWGCAIRVGQMMLLNTLKSHYRLSTSEKTCLLKTIEENLLSAPYSLHNILHLAGLGKQPGDWFSPSDISNSLDKMLKIYPCKDFKLLTLNGSMVCKDQIFASGYGMDLEEIKAIFEDNSEELPSVWKNGVLLLIPLMLGCMKIDKRYYRTVKVLLECKYSVGIIGERKNAALYLVGYQGEKVFFLVPHHIKRACRDIRDFNERIGEYSSHSLLSQKISQLGSSMTLGFYFRGLEEFCGFERFVYENEEAIQGVILIKRDTLNFSVVDTNEDSDFVML